MTTAAMDVVDTKRAERRKLSFTTPDQMLAEVERVVAAERAGILRRTGNWTCGQTLGHLAFWTGTAYGEYPMKPPAVVKIILRLLGKKKFISDPMRVGIRIPGCADGTLGTDVLGLDEGLSRFKAAWERLRREDPGRDHPIFGPMTHDEYIRLNLRHAELHLGFLHPG